MGFPNRERKQRHAGHFRKPKPEKKLPVAVQKAREEADPYKDGRTRIFLDDERGCPAGWTLAENVAEFKQILEACPPADLAAVYLDWHLGTGITPGDKAEEYLERSEEHTSELQTLMRIKNDVSCLKNKK